MISVEIAGRDTEIAVDHGRYARTGLPEVVYGLHKTDDQVVRAFSGLLRENPFALVTRIRAGCADRIKKAWPHARHSETARALAVGRMEPIGRRLAVITAGTSDVPIAEEAAFTADFLGSEVHRYYDVGVAGLHRLTVKIELIKQCDVIIVVAGMDAALPSVVAGLCPQPIIAVPSSVGYGAAFDGLTALLGMLNACAPGLAVVNIDNGFGAAAMAHKMLLPYGHSRSQDKAVTR